jgi:GT2 family glycosyltransferase
MAIGASVTDVSVLVATCGDQRWIELAKQRALPSARALGVPVIHRHAATLHEARNACLYAATTPFVVHLDADDELPRDYLDAMRSGTAEVRAPAVRYVQGGHVAPDRVPTVWGHSHACSAECLPYGNWIVVGAWASRSRLIDIGGWRDYSWSEDWDLWLRAYLAGATVETIPAAVYIAYVRYDSRNRAASQEQRLAAHRAIARANGVPVP